ncbi:serine hydroxymethyltransferase [Patescibacteria group bacterium]
MVNIRDFINKEEKRQRETLMLIPSENYASMAVREAVGSVLMNKYSEGYPTKRYYQGNTIVDDLETLAIEKAKKLFNVAHVNVQPYSGSPANSAVLFALLNYGDKIMGIKLSSGGHLTHGHPNITFSGKYFNSVQFGTDDDGIIDYREVEKLVKKEKPELLFIGTTAYPLILDWKKFSEIAKSVGAWLVADISHVAGLVIAGVYPSPKLYAHVITTTTHKTLRGPRGAMIMVTKKGINKDPELPKKIDRAVFPGLGGGPHDNTTAAIAQALIEAGTPEFKKYGKQVVINTKVLASELKKGGLTLVAGGTESHLMVIDLRSLELSGSVVAEALEVAGIVVNKNSVPNDTAPPFYPSGIRLGTPGVTTRGMKEVGMKKISVWILDVVNYVHENKYHGKDDIYLLGIANKIKLFLKKYPMP